MVKPIFLNEASNDISRTFPEIPKQLTIEILSGVGSDVYANLAPMTQDGILRFIVSGLSKGYIGAMTSGGLALTLSLFLNRGKMFA